MNSKSLQFKDNTKQVKIEKEKFAAASLKLSGEISDKYESQCPFLQYRVHHTYEKFKFEPKSKKKFQRKKNSILIH